MTAARALQVIKDFQLWRLGKTDAFPHEPHTITEAIDLVIDNLEIMIHNEKEEPPAWDLQTR